MSLFSNALKSLLDETNLFDRSSWAEFLGVTESKIESWVQDEDIPKPYRLSMVVLALERSSNIPIEPLGEFYRISKMNSMEVSPHGVRMLPTVNEYYNRPDSTELSSALVKMSPEEQGEYLKKIYHQDCECEVCKNGIEGYLKKQKKLLEEYGWVAEYVPDENGMVNCHTHGLPENFEHPDLQIVMPLLGNVLHGILTVCVDKIKEGITFNIEQEFSGILSKGYKVRFVEANESGRDVLRIIIPDEDGNLKKENLSDVYLKQYDNLTD